MTRMRVVDPGLLTTVQDLGRSGSAHLGVPRSGALDMVAHRLANRLVGNPETEATLETTLMGVSVSFDKHVVIAATGAHCQVWVGGRSVAFGAPRHVAPGEVVRLGPSLQARSYLAVSGGIRSAVVLGSRSTDLLSGLGAEPLVAGQVIEIGAAHGDPKYVDTALARPLPTSRIRVLPGPRIDWFADAAVQDLVGGAYEVTPQSNRIGLRLRGPNLQRVVSAELPSEPMVLGAIQVPPSGQPVVFLNDHPTTGGYPVIAVVHPEDLPNCAQARPGDTLHFDLLHNP
jgi:biotin-dependent carboxylase-like uncharacterized protein